MDLVSFAFGGLIGADDTRPLYIDADQPSRAIHGRGLRRLVRGLVAGFRAYGLEPSDCVLVQLSGNTVLHPALQLGIIGAGGTYMSCNHATSVYEMEHLIQLVSPRFILTHPGGLSVVLSACAKEKSSLSSRRVAIVDEESIDRLVLFAASDTTAEVANISVPAASKPFRVEDLLTFGESEWQTLDEATAQQTPATMFLTSGTSGLTKAAVRSHTAMLSQIQAVHYEPPFAVKRIVALPLHHLLGDYWTTVFPIRYGHPAYILRRFEVTNFLDALQRFAITETYLVPTMIHIFLSLDASTARAGLASLRYVGVAGAPSDENVLQRFRALLHPDAYVGPFYGMTEAGVITQYRYGDTQLPGGLGVRLMGYEVMLAEPVDEDNVNQTMSSAPVVVTGDKQPGEVLIRGPGMFSGYRASSAVPPAVTADGWFRTGDMGYWKDGHFSLVGRLKELIKVRGYSVAPAEIEAVLLEHPAVQDVGVIRTTASDGSTEAPRAYVVTVPDTAQPSVDELAAWVLDKLAWYKGLDGGVVFVPSIPRTEGGKIQRARLMQLDSRRDELARILA
ncbi:adenylate-forming enzyme [Aspergillus terreus]|uniref:Adenylate-forming enzyme n=1 Tax=Aspergillus terreus TaxID=33178 RepID=A0A5M3Z735_ASPTE|nr:hypothetical protein ATETN484_0010015500 [Aspergillus terreus]GFF18205.1 adenylate-forming enzyme [Aspergillus terreus]